MVAKVGSWCFGVRGEAKDAAGQGPTRPGKYAQNVGRVDVFGRCPFSLSKLFVRVCLPHAGVVGWVCGFEELLRYVHGLVVLPIGTLGADI